MPSVSIIILHPPMSGEELMDRGWRILCFKSHSITKGARVCVCVCMCVCACVCACVRACVRAYRAYLSPRLCDRQYV